MAKKVQMEKNGTVITDKMRGQLLYLENEISKHCIMDAGYCTGDSNCGATGCYLTYQSQYGVDCSKVLKVPPNTTQIKCVEGYKPSVIRDKKNCVFTCVPKTS